MEIKEIISVNELGYNLNPDVDNLLAQGRNDIRVAMHSELELIPDKDLVIVSLNVKYETPKSTLLTYGLQTLIYVAGCVEKTKNLSEAQIKSLPEVPQLLELAAGMMRGALMVRADMQNKEDVKNLYLPIIHGEKLLERLVVK
jgi:hypothetical protein